MNAIRGRVLLLAMLLGACAPSASPKLSGRGEINAEPPPRLTFVDGSWDTPPTVISWTSAYHRSIATPVEVSVAGTISVDGRAESLRIVFPSIPGFSYDVLDAAKQWVFAPAMSDGVPVEARVVFPVMLRPK